MTEEQKNIANNFMSMVEEEYAFCTEQMHKANAAATSDNPDNNNSVDQACSEIDVIRKYWFNRLVCLAQIVESRDYSWGRELREKNRKQSTSLS